VCQSGRLDNMEEVQRSKFSNLRNKSVATDS